MLDSSICRAIFERKLLTLTFKYGTGVVEPYCFGRTKDGTDLLRAYQVRGASDEGEPTGWKFFRFDAIVAMAISQDPFIPRPDFRRNDRAFERIHCQL
jgi:hypothetical protein